VNVLDPRDPTMMNPVTPPEFATEMRYQQDRAVQAARTVIAEADNEFAVLTGRRYGGLFEGYRMDDAEFALAGLGTWAGIAREVVDQMRSEGKKAGLIKLRYMRPFPGEELRQATLNLKALGTFDRSAAFNGYGAVFTEVRNALYGSGITVTDHVAGIGGRDITFGMVRDMYDIVERSAQGEKVRECTWHGLRGEQE
jgi:pyruvate ferredoxin oxidoreductase alpha subunit